MTAVNNNASPMDGAPVIDFDKFKPTRSFTAARKRKDLAMRVLIALAFIVALIPLFSVLLTTIVSGVKRLNLNFLSYNMTGVVGGNPTPSGGYGGIQHAIIGTLEITFGAMVISIPIGLMCAVYLVEYSNRGKLSRVIPAGRCDEWYSVHRRTFVRILDVHDSDWAWHHQRFRRFRGTVAADAADRGQVF